METKVPRLSEAMRIGAAWKPQAFGVIHNGDKTATCAMGAAIEGAGLTVSVTNETEYVGNGRYSYLAPAGTSVWRMPAEWIDLLTKPQNCPECNYGFNNTRTLITHLNDEHTWSRERIADWLELQEPIDPPEETPAETPEDEPSEAAKKQLTTQTVEK